MPSAAEPRGGQAVRRSRAGRLLAVLVLVLGVALDQGAKALAVARLEPGVPVPVLGELLSLELIRNPGAAFSMGTNATVVLSLLAITATLVGLVYFLPRVGSRGAGVLLGAALAGVVGNLLDRLFRAPGPLRGHVVDFFAVPHFAIFNVADILLTCSAVVVIGYSLFETVRERNDQVGAATEAAEDLAATGHDHLPPAESEDSVVEEPDTAAGKQPDAPVARVDDTPASRANTTERRGDAWPSS